MKKIVSFVVFPLLLGLLSLLLWGCEFAVPKVGGVTVPATAQNAAGTTRTPLPIGDVLLQAFYWDTSPQGGWWRQLSSKLEEWHDVGITGIWLPPISKAGSGLSSMGYDPYDYYDFGQYDQKGSRRTRFGSRAELDALIDAAHSQDIAVIADIVLNHNSGGELEYNPYRNIDTWTLFQPKSDKFWRSASDFHPNLDHQKDSGVFAGFPDLDLEKTYVQDWLYGREDSIAKYYRDVVGIDAWRFDFVKGFSPHIVRDWLAAAGGWAVGELWDGNLGLIETWTRDANASAFDFPNFYNMKAAFAGGDLRKLDDDALWKRNENKAVTFVGNHDTEERPEHQGNDFPNWHTAHAYAYMMMMPGLPMIFYLHYEIEGHKQAIDQMIQLRRKYAAGKWTVRYSTAKEYIVEREGHEGRTGLLLYLNLNNRNVSRRVDHIHWQNGVLRRRLAGALQPDTSVSVISAPASVNFSGYSAAITAPANGYAIWTLGD